MNSSGRIACQIAWYRRVRPKRRWRRQEQQIPDGEVMRYRIEVEEGLPLDAEAFAREVHATLGDPQGLAVPAWHPIRAGRLR